MMKNPSRLDNFFKILRHPRSGFLVNALIVNFLPNSLNTHEGKRGRFSYQAD
jgi:hypothetical protein